MSEKKRSEVETVTYEFPYMRRPVSQSGWESFALFLYNPHKHEVFGRTGKSWAQLALFYCLFYLGLSALFSLCMYGLLQSIDPASPSWQLEESLIGTNPGLAFRPLADSDNEKIATLIQYDPKDPEIVKAWTDRIDEFLKTYQEKIKPGVVKNLETCDFANPPRDNTVCSVDPSKLGPCNPNEGYGYNRTSPCVFLKLNKIFGWKPEPYSDINSLPAVMPEDLVQYIKSRPEAERQQIWVSCRGQHESDRENFNSDLDYFPSRGFPAYYYPFRNEKGYMSPLVAVQFKNIKENVLVNIECRVWAKNMIYRGSALDRKGSVVIQILVA